MEAGDREKLILAIEDRPQHLQIIEQVLAKSRVRCQLKAIATFELALDFFKDLRQTNPRQTDSRQADLSEQSDRAPSHHPDLILLDLQMGDNSGFRLLSAVKSDPVLRRIPIVVLTPLAEASDILESYRQQCNCYVVEPQNLDHLTRVVNAIESFWLNIVTLPIK